MAKKYRVSNKPRLAESGLAYWTNYERSTEPNPNRANTRMGRVSKKRVMQLRYLQSRGIKPVSKDILQHLKKQSR